MALSLFLAALILFFASNSPAQVYKYRDKEGNVTFTDNLSSSLVKDGVSSKSEKPKADPSQKKRINEGNRNEGGKNEGVKDVNQLGEEILQKELAKPPEKQDQRLIQELREVLYGEGAQKASKEQENKEWNFWNKLGIKTSKSQ